MDVTWPQAGTWAGAACAVLAIVAWWLVEREKKRAEMRKRYAQLRGDVLVAEEAYRDALENGTALAVRRAAAELDERRRKMDLVAKAIAGLCVLLVLGGCRTTAPQESIVRLDEHIRIVAPGETVPDYPEGESRWWLCTPSGMMEMVPQYRQQEL